MSVCPDMFVYVCGCDTYMVNNTHGVAQAGTMIKGCFVAFVCALVCRVGL